MAESKPRILLSLDYARSAQEALENQRTEEIMEAPPQATQRKITLESLDLVTARRPEVQVFNELLVQYPFGKAGKIRKVVPDNMVVIHAGPIALEGSFDLPFQTARPFWVLEYVSKKSKRKDYDDNFRKYERHLKVPYYLLFEPEAQELSLFKRGKSRYVSVKPNAAGRLPLPELELEMALLDGWVRFWFRGELLPLPADLQRQLDDARREVALARQEAANLRRERDSALEEVARLRALLEPGRSS